MRGAGACTVKYSSRPPAKSDRIHRMTSVPHEFALSFRGVDPAPSAPSKAASAVHIPAATYPR
jgi:hypothetical protein